MIRLSDRDREAYDVIARWLAEHGRAPSFKELGRALNVTSTATVYHRVKRLQHAGIIDYEPRGPRTLRIIVCLLEEVA